MHSKIFIAIQSYNSPLIAIIDSVISILVQFQLFSFLLKENLEIKKLDEDQNVILVIQINTI